MSRPKGDILIGRRMYEEIDRLFPSLMAAAKALRCRRSSIYSWADGRVPGCFTLAKLHYLGGDVLYVLTGERSKEDGK